MKNNEKGVSDVINEAFAKINKFEGGNELFYSRFHKSRAVVSTWKSGKVVPVQTDMIKFMKVSNEVIKECTVESEKRNKEQSKLMNEFTNLTSI